MRPPAPFDVAQAFATRELRGSHHIEVAPACERLNPLVVLVPLRDALELPLRQEVHHPTENQPSLMHNSPSPVSKAETAAAELKGSRRFSHRQLAIIKKLRHIALASLGQCGGHYCCGVCNPPLASGARRHDEVVECAERLLVARLAAPGLPPRRERVCMRFVWRESTGPRPDGAEEERPAVAVMP